MTKIEKPTIKDSAKISFFLAFYLIHATQIGVGILGYQRYIVQVAGYDAWIGVILCGVYFHFIIWILYKLLNASEGDIVSIHGEIFGRWLGNILSSLFIFYFLIQAFSIIRPFIMIVQAWMFPDMKIWQFASIYILLIYYAISSGFRVVVGVCFFGVVIPAYLYLTFIYPIWYGEPRNILPILDHSFMEILQASKRMTYSFLGVEALLVYYPYFKEPKKSQKWAHIGNLTTTLCFLLVTFSSFIYYSEDKISHTIWATLTMWKIVSFSIVERFEMVGIATWVLVILPNLCLLLWAASRIGKRITTIRQRSFVIALLLIMFVAICLVEDIESTYLITDFSGKIGTYCVFIYVPLLTAIYLIRKKVKKTS